MNKKISLSLLALVLVAGGIAALAASETQVISVTAKIEKGEEVNVKNIDFGTVKPLSITDKNLKISLCESINGNNEEDNDLDCNTTNLIKNGSFEVPVVTESEMWDVFPSGTSGLEWTVKWESSTTTFNGKTRPSTALLEIQAGVNGWLAQEGDQYAELDADWGGPDSDAPGAPSLVRIYQEAPTVKGQTYKLSYYFSPRPNTPAGENILTVKINGTTVQTQTAGSTENQTQWNLFEKEFVATGSSAKIEFIGGGTPNGIGTFLDNVRVVGCEGGAPSEKIKYTIAQKPSCVNKNNPDDRVPAQKDDDDYECPSGYVKMPVLCPYLSKTQSDADSDTKSVPAFHGSVSNWDVEDTKDNLAKGALSSSDKQDMWIIDFAAPCIKGSCPSDWAHNGYELKTDLAGKALGCDLWIESDGEIDLEM